MLLRLISQRSEGARSMSSSSTATPDEQTLYAALELSKNSWLLAIQFPDRDNPSLRPIKGGDADGLIGLNSANTNKGIMPGKSLSMASIMISVIAQIAENVATVLTNKTPEYPLSDLD